MPTPILVAAPAEPVISTAEMKAHSRVEVADDDALIAALVLAATDWFQTALDRQLVAATYELRLPDFGWPCYELPYPPLRSVASVTYLDTASVVRVLSSGTYVVATGTTPGYIRLAAGFTWPAVAIHPEAVKIQFVCGYGDADDVPPLIKAGIKLLASHWYENREAVSLGGAATDIPLAVDSIVQAARAYRF